MNYKSYRLSAQETAVSVLKAAALAGVLAYFFYSSILAWMILFAASLPLVIRSDREYLRRKRQDRIKKEFKDFLVCLPGSLGAGYSLENAFELSAGELTKLYANTSILEGEIRGLNKKVRCGQNIETVMLEFGIRSGVKEIEGFANLMAVTKKKGGNINEVIRQAASSMESNQLVNMEIDTMIAAKLLEGRIMLLMPIGIIGYMRLTNPDYMEPLYGNWFGALFMTACILAVAFAGYQIRRITDIKL